MKQIKNRYEMTYSINNGGSFPPKPYYYSSLRKAIDDGKVIVSASHQPQAGNRSYIHVVDTLTGKSVYEGLLWDRRTRYINLTEED